jgi:hypothetical protein
MKSLSRKLCLCAIPALAALTVALVSQSAAAQAYYGPQGSPGGQYAYGQPSYPQPSYPQSGYAQPAYPQQYGAPQYAQPQYAQPQPSYAPQPAAPQMMGAAQAPMSPDDIAQLVAPVALYPDALLAQILAGATYPAQVAAADQWVHTMGFSSPDQVAAAASAQTMWDPSVKALTAYPQVLDLLSGNLQWTTVLGNAYYNQPQDVMQTVQVLRMRAEQAGNLQSSPQMQVVQNPGYIALQPVNPDVVYVPTYNPWTVYGAPIRPYSGFSFTGILSTLANGFMGSGFGGRGGFGGIGGGGIGGSGALQFLASFALGAFNRTPFGLISWGLDWLMNALTFHHSNYYTASTSVRDWGLPHGGPRYFSRASYGGSRGGFGGVGDSYHHEAIAIHQNENFGNQRAVAHQDGFARTQPALDRGGFDRGQQQMAYNRGAESAYRAPVGNAFASRAASPQPVRPGSYPGSYSNPYRGQNGSQYGGGMQPSRSVYQSPQNSYTGGNNRSGYDRSGNMAYGAPSSGYKPFGGGHESDSFGGSRGSSYKEPKFKEPKFSEPKFKEPKFKAPHESSHGGGGGHHH